MTTIAYSKGLIAYDSRLTVGNRIIYDDLDKLIIKDGVAFFIGGDVGDDAKLIDMYFGKIETTAVNCIGLVLDEHGVLWVCSVDSSEDRPSFWKMPILTNAPYAIGSGSAYALAAMDLGYSAEAGISAAMKRDTCTGGTIRVFDIKGYLESSKSSKVEK